MKSLTRLFRTPAARSGLIDVRQLIDQLSDTELLEAADAYFSGLTLESEQCHKPFSNPKDAVNITRHLGLLLEAAELFTGADVMDFGCATGWLTYALANMGCYAVGVDISPAALTLAQGMRSHQFDRGTGSARFAAYDGNRLPLEDESLDCILCFDSFHHIKDQSQTLREFARVLRPGGRVAMVEPGPNHSRTPQSQMEMSRYKVIENDIVMSDVASAASAAGLSRPQMLVQFQKPVSVPLDLFEQWTSSGEMTRLDAAKVLSTLCGQLTDTQVFYMTRGAAVLDSRRPEGLAAELTFVSVVPAGPEGTFALRVRIRNCGESVWIGEAGRIGQVNLGCQLMGPGGVVEALDYARFPLGVDRLLCGEETVMVVQVRLPKTPGCYLRFDLVAEGVAWFEQMGRCQPLDWRPADER